jgi:hypothetical protein
MKKLLCIMLLIMAFFSLKINAQDIILRVDGSKLLAKVLDYRTDTIKYKSFDDQQGPTFMLMKSEIKMINLDNGTTLIFNADKEINQEVINKTKEKELKKERIFYYGSTFYLNNDDISYRKTYSIIEEKGTTDLLKTLKRGHLMNGIGNTMIYSGLSSVLFGIAYSALPADEKLPGLIMFCAGLPVMTSGFVINGVGKKAIKKACGGYNDYLKTKNAWNIRIGNGSSGYGLVFNF